MQPHKWSEKTLHFTVSRPIWRLVQYTFAGHLSCLDILEQNFLVWLRLQACVLLLSLSNCRNQAELEMVFQHILINSHFGLYFTFLVTVFTFSIWYTLYIILHKIVVNFIWKLSLYFVFYIKEDLRQFTAQLHFHSVIYFVLKFSTEYTSQEECYCRFHKIPN